MARGRYRGETPDLLEKIRELEERISRLERTPQAGNAAVNTGGITIRGGSLEVLRGGSFLKNNDSFSRLETDGWGNTEGGTAYTITDGPASAFYVDRSNGIIAVPTVNTTHRALVSILTVRNFDFTAEFLVTVTPTGGYVQTKVDFRWDDVNNRLGLNVEVNTDSTISASIYQVVSSVTTTLAGPVTIPNLQHSTTVPIKLRISALQKFIKVKLWRVIDDEPSAWQVFTSNVDDSLSLIDGFGAIGLAAFLQSTNSNTLPVIIKWDNFSLADPVFVDPPGNEGFISIGSNAIINNEQGMNIYLGRSDSVLSAYKDVDGITASGEVAAILGTVDGGAADPTIAFPSWTFYDKSGDAIVSDSLTARRGFEHPRLATTWYDPVAYKTTTSGSFTNVASSEWYQYHPHLRVRLLVNNDAGNVSELRLIETPALTNTFASFTTTSGYFGYVDLLLIRSMQSNGDGPNGNNITFSVDQRRVSGAGTVRCLVVSMTGIDLSWFNPY